MLNFVFMAANICGTSKSVLVERNGVTVGISIGNLKGKRFKAVGYID